MGLLIASKKVFLFFITKPEEYLCYLPKLKPIFTCQVFPPPPHHLTVSGHELLHQDHKYKIHNKVKGSSRYIVYITNMLNCLWGSVIWFTESFNSLRGEELILFRILQPTLTISQAQWVCFECYRGWKTQDIKYLHKLPQLFADILWDSYVRYSYTTWYPDSSACSTSPVPWRAEERIDLA